jgi:peptide/nickel transport system substrate-binding protein
MTDAPARRARRGPVNRTKAAMAALVPLLMLGACSASGPATQSGDGPGDARAGGTLRVAMAGNGTQETFNPTKANSLIDYAHVREVYDSLTRLQVDGTIAPSLAESVTPNNDATEWTITLPGGLTFQDGSPVTADDIIYTLEYNMDPKTASLGAGNLSSVNPDAIEKVNDRTVKVGLSEPNSFFDANLSDFHLAVIPKGTVDFTHPVGTGPFMLKTFSPGKEATLSAFKGYRVAGQPLVAELRMISIDDTQARTNALLGGQVDVIAGVAFSQVDSLSSQKSVQIHESAGDSWIGEYMQTSGEHAGPFADPKVREALRLLIDRKQIVSNVFFGHARVGNDVYSPHDPGTPSDLEQRTYDPERARELLKEAGYDGLKVTLYTGDLTPGIKDMSTLMVEQAKAAGVTIKLETQPTDQYFATSYMQQPFGSTYWSGNSLATTYANNMAPTALTNETNWHDEEWGKLYREALRTTDRKRANSLLQDAQRILWERGGFMIPVFPNLVDAASNKVAGIKESPIYNLGEFDFTEVGFTS